MLVLRPAGRLFVRHYKRIQTRSYILGIESSCDDTGAAIVSCDSGDLKGEALSSQLSSRFGGVIPTFALNFHAEKIPTVVDECLKDAQISMDQIKYIAVTNRPGLSGSLRVGTNYAKYLSKKYQIPLIPVHHMEAHALTARMIQPDLTFPFMVLLISGGHCLLAMANDIDDYRLLGQSMDSSPGETFDKVARRLKLHTVGQLRDISGGKAIETFASQGDLDGKVEFPLPLLHSRDCMFSFCGLKSHVNMHVDREEKLQTLPPDELLPNVSDICRGLQHATAKHLCMRLQRAIQYTQDENMWPSDVKRTLVVSGGVACNQMIRSSLQKVCDVFEFRTVFPPVKYCTDNGVMIAWNGFEKLRRGLSRDIIGHEEAFDMDIQTRCPLGEDISERVVERNIKCKWIKI